MTDDGRNAVETHDSWNFRPNDEIDQDLVVIRHVGGGERYEVFEAWDRRLFTRVAAKVLRPHRVAEDRAISALRREGGIGARLIHPNLVRVLRWTDAGPRPHLVLELVTARSVEDHLEDIGPVRVPETCLLGIRVLAALQYMHGEGVLHLDVKSANVTMGDPPRLLDLSLAREGTTLRLDRSVGTPAYMSPEQCRRENLTPATDLFGLGATLYEALIATQPFSEGVDDAEDPVARYPQLAEEPTPLRDLAPEIPRPLEDVVMSCLARDPKRRPTSARGCAIVLEQVIESLGLDDLLAWPRGLPASRHND
jgi:serine/threonine protein kinase